MKNSLSNKSTDMRNPIVSPAYGRPNPSREYLKVQLDTHKPLVPHGYIQDCSGRTPHYSKNVKPSRGFTLVEILIVVMILGIMAAIVIPKFSSATVQARESMLRENLRIMRTQLGAYRAQHWSVSPGYDQNGNLSEQTFINQMTRFTNEYGEINNIVSANFPYGPYMSRIPENPLNDLNSITIIADNDPFPAQPAETGGWIYKPKDNMLRADMAGFDMEGISYYSY